MLLLQTQVDYLATCTRCWRGWWRIQGQCRCQILLRRTVTYAIVLCAHICSRRYFLEYIIHQSNMPGIATSVRLLNKSQCIIDALPLKCIENACIAFASDQFHANLWRWDFLLEMPVKYFYRHMDRQWSRFGRRGCNFCYIVLKPPLQSFDDQNTQAHVLYR